MPEQLHQHSGSQDLQFTPTRIPLFHAMQRVGVIIALVAITSVFSSVTGRDTGNPDQPGRDTHRTENMRGFQVLIERVADNDKHARLLDIAEHYYPPVADVLAAAASDYTCSRQASPKSITDQPWWYCTRDEVRIPYAITHEAVEYYADKVLKSAMTVVWKDIAPAMRFMYEAHVSWQDNWVVEGKQYKNVYVVKMKMSYSATVASLNRIAFSKNRIILIDSQERVILVTGDGVTPVLVS